MSRYPFVQLRHELTAEKRHGPNGSSQKQNGCENNGATVDERPIQRAFVSTTNGKQPRGFIVDFVVSLRSEDIRCHGGDIDEREDQRSDDRGADRERHRPEHPSFDAFEREDRQVHRDDDRHAKENRSPDLERRQPQHILSVGGIAAFKTQSAHEILDHDHRGIDDQAEIERAKAHQIGGNAKAPHGQKRHKER